MHGVGGHRLNIATKSISSLLKVGFTFIEVEEDPMILMSTDFWGLNVVILGTNSFMLHLLSGCRGIVELRIGATFVRSPLCSNHNM